VGFGGADSKATTGTDHGAVPLTLSERAAESAGTPRGPANLPPMRKVLATALGVALAVLPGASAGAQQADAVPLFAGGGTNLSNGYFFPGTATYDGSGFVGVPYQIQQGQNIQFINTDVAVLTNAHAMVSVKKTKKGRALFRSGYVRGPATEIVKTSHLKPGVYPYYCSVHYGMYGLLEVVKL
jgi:plastocyanin